MFRQTRVQHPVKSEEDSTYTYLFIIYPVVGGAGYEIDNFLKKMYDEQKANEYFKMLTDTEAREQTAYRVIQSRN